MLRCRDGSLYTGSAKDVLARLRKHQQGRASRYTRARLPVMLVWRRRLASWGAALREEYRIKQLRRADKEALVKSRSRGVRRPPPARRRHSLLISRSF